MCTTILVGKNASATGEILVGHNEDSPGRYMMNTHIVPALRRGVNEKIRFEKNSAELPLPGERARLFWSEARSYVIDGGASFCDFYANGNGVVICSNNCTAPKEDKPELTDGGIGYAVRRLVAEGAKSAYNAVEIAAKLVDEYGYFADGRSYNFADKNEIWVFQVVKGKHYAVSRVPDDEVVLMPNHYTIRTPDKNAPGYDKLVKYAIERGWADSEENFDFARAYQKESSYRAMGNIIRHWRGLETLLGRPVDIGAELPFSIKPERKIGIGDIKKVLRLHYENTPDDVSCGNSPHAMHTRPICTRTTIESCIVQIRADHDMTIIRRALGRPCLSPFTPWYFGTEKIPNEYGNYSEDAVKNHFEEIPNDVELDPKSAWFAHSELQRIVDPIYKTEAARIKKEIHALEEMFEKELAEFESKQGKNITDITCDFASRAVKSIFGYTDKF